MPVPRRVPVTARACSVAAIPPAQTAWRGDAREAPVPTDVCRVRKSDAAAANARPA